LIAEVIEENSLFAKEKKVVVSFVRPESPLSKVKINRQRVKQVLQNLLDNAIKYSSIGDKGRVAVGLENDGKYLRLTVKDNGIGIPKGDQSKIFERFSRGSNSTKLDPGGGSGLGLYIAKAVVEQGGGKVWFDSKEGEGTTFYATFPLL
jgi:signal transduction histidine kinase